MREILFKAKRLDNGEWVEGDLVRHYENQRRFIACDQMAYTSETVGIKRLVSENSHEVIPETVCQYTELKDKNGKKIFIGDILKGGHGNYIIVPARNGWQLKRLKNNGEIGTNSTAAYLHLYEIIGNIHDKE